MGLLPVNWPSAASRKNNGRPTNSRHRKNGIKKAPATGSLPTRSENQEGGRRGGGRPSIYNNNVLFYVPFLLIGAHSPLQRKERNTVKTNFRKHTHTRARARAQRERQKVEQLEEVRFQRWFKRCECVWWSNLAWETVSDRRCSIKMISDQVSVCTQREDKEWKYQEKSVAGGLVCKLSRVK